MQGGRGAALRVRVERKNKAGGFKMRTSPGCLGNKNGSGNSLAAWPPNPARSARSPCDEPGPLSLTVVGMSAPG